MIPPQPDLIQIPLITSSVKLYARQTYLDTSGTPTNIQDLKKYCLITMLEAKPGDIFFVTADSLEDRIGLAIANIGLTEIPDNHPAIQQNNLIEIPNLLPPTHLNYSYIYPIKLQNAQRIQLLQKYLSACFLVI